MLTQQYHKIKILLCVLPCLSFHVKCCCLLDTSPLCISPSVSSPGLLDVTLNAESRWRRRYLTVQGGLLLIFPRRESKFATARVRLPHHGLHGAHGETGQRLAFKITRRAKVTLYMKVGREEEEDIYSARPP